MSLLYHYNSSNTLIKLATGSKRQITYFEHAAHRQLQSSSLSSKLSVYDDIVSECLYIGNQTLIKEFVSIVWLFLMKIGWFEISMIRNGTTPTFRTKCLNFMLMFIMFGWNIVSHSNSWNVIVFCMKGNVEFCLMLSPRNWLNNTFFFLGVVIHVLMFSRSQKN